MKQVQQMEQSQLHHSSVVQICTKASKLKTFRIQTALEGALSLQPKQEQQKQYLQESAERSQLDIWLQDH
ncbi:uncharacterized protein PHALS_15399 [Plasmopara halstedii]|uniref:Uncharacterized protein n=1 Tax=Plasmopara halstedii TaxID=4781 RepID=A0A0P1AUB3_PLAHL|nr:uncharacterized protein PHALS_15399 [Plasmopara halstedii]CEG44704.1 hypothetical protein PHALS_15399 [Plasmopara halstedii]|eukprot:XP_024581073.1 hypothetical protein PHALS_15399 [Plasmopara halstedii]